MASYENIIYDKPIDGVARITLNRPDQLNALNLPLLYEIYAGAEEAKNDSSVVVLVYRGAGRAFCAGRDFKYSAKLQVEEGWHGWRDKYRDFGPQTWNFPKATIAQVHGYALGGGHNLSTGCDIVYAAEGTRFGYPEARYGILAGSLHVWNHMMGPRRAKEYLFTGRNFSAEQAYDYGLINQVFPLEELEDQVLALASDIVAIEKSAPGYIQANKYQINAQHPEWWIGTTLNPAVLAQVPLDAEFGGVARANQEKFFGGVAERGFKAAVDDLHKDFTSRS